MMMMMMMLLWVLLQVRALESDTLFNAGKGSVLTNKGTVEMEACIMDGRTKDCGAVSGLSTVVHPVSLARLVMENSPHVYLGFDGAEEFARIQVQNPCYYVLLLITNRKRKGSTSYVYNGEGEARNTPKWSSQLWSRHVPKPS